ncbi:MAG: type II toxin-antitoxin system Phd/YefM family antitoxin [Desulfococcaceae bacterium]|jgi:antitoxin (DNA-binding transcriptional repressor) of toxin-antitoxin stability system|nr:type II toxin-antitoxin system Phd/YefM family antitoxin [Desulfococcaceae bacterium]
MKGNMMKSLSIDQGSPDIFTILDEIEKNQEIIVIYRNGKPVARISPYERKASKRITPHPLMSRINISYDPTETLTQDEWQE